MDIRRGKPSDAAAIIYLCSFRGGLNCCTRGPKQNRVWRPCVLEFVLELARFPISPPWRLADPLRETVRAFLTPEKRPAIKSPSL